MTSSFPSSSSSPSASPSSSSTSSSPSAPSSILLRAPPETDVNEFSPVDNSNSRKLDALKKNPLVPLGAIGTGMVLMAGLFAFKSGNAKLSQRLMKARVVAQGATLAVLAVSVGGGMATKVAGEGS